MSITIKTTLVCYSCPLRVTLDLAASLDHNGKLGLDLPRDWRRFGLHEVLCPTCSEPIRAVEPKAAP